MKNKEREVYKEKGERLLKSFKTCNYAHIKALLDNGADVNYADSKRITPLQEAVGWGNIEIVQLLLDRGADINAKDYRGYTVLHSALNPEKKTQKDGNINMIKFLLEKGARKSKNIWESGEFFNAAEVNPNPDVLNLFYDNGAHINEKGKWDYTPLMAAVRCNESLKVIQYLIDKGADINAVDWEGASVFMHAAANGKDDISRLKLLLKHGIKTDAVTKNGENAYDFACQQGNDNVQEFLESIGIK